MQTQISAQGNFYNSVFSNKTKKNNLIHSKAKADLLGTEMMIQVPILSWMDWEIEIINNLPFELLK